MHVYGRGYGMMSLQIVAIFSNPSKPSFRRLWNSSGANFKPNGMRSQRYLPNGVQKVVKKLDSSSNTTCRKPSLASDTLKTLDFFSCGTISSMVGVG